MVEENNPKINVDELIQKIRQEVAKRESISQPVNREFRVGAIIVENYINHIEALLHNAEFKSQVRTHWPEKFKRFPFNLTGWLQNFFLKLYNFFRREQRAVNYSLIEALRDSVVLNRNLSEQIAALQTQLNGISDRLSATDERISTAEKQISATDERISTAEKQISATDERISTAEKQISATDERISTAEKQISATDERISTAEKQISATDERISTTDERNLRNDSYIKNDLVQQKRLLTLFLEEARQRLPEAFNQEQLQTFVDQEQHLPDAFYVAFEDQFRGSREEILNRLKVYLPLIEEVKVGTLDNPILDVGCGRGEWLELLHKSGYAARGIDINRVMLEQCRARGLEVIEADVIDYLQSLPDAIYGAVTGFHIIEHLPFNLLMKLVDETLRVLTPGGMVIFETPNPRNILVGSGDFYRDPTHRHPIHPDTINFVAHLQGFIRSDVYVFEKQDGKQKLSSLSQKRFEELNDYISVSRDFALIAYKA
ncbi:methyltransferase domain-containing protein [Trichocoleus sp. FACHB-90]|uniref:methyltransferase domain-containing protein n=1 Tax=Cyanophyceae TaxID=3028117 RepID=UPI0016845CAB|nr:methyltransferase domain-containing protein [Trichocoleus sp. FACHB-90]MBD1926666.1 methyltransferase domain-containing protein [Trichocoleus sp. FACHB-90]